jgi:hypothetical protein
MKPFTIHIGACLLGLLAFGGTATGASIPSNGYTNDFSVQPVAADWSTVSIAGAAGGANDSTNPTQVGTNIAALTMAGITNQLAASNASPPVATARAVWVTNGYVQTRPTGNRITVLMATLINGTGTNVSALNLSYQLTLVSQVAEEVPGHRVYYSLSGATNSWVAVNALSGADTNLSVNSMSASLPLGAWATNAPLYLLWADDNASAAPDTALQIDNVVITPGALDPVAFTTQPQSTVVAERSPAAFSFTASGTLQDIQWYRDNVAIPGANATNYTLASALVPDSGSQFYAIIGNPLNSATSSVATLTVLADTNAPIALAATYDGVSSNVVVRFSEALRSNSISAVNFSVFESLSLASGPPVINATLLDATNVLVSLSSLLNTGVSYSISAAGVQDTALTPNTMSPNPTVLVIRPSIRLINFTDVWKYDINNGDRTDTGWQNVGFNDSAWSSGPAGLGRDNSINGVLLNTIIPYMSNGVPCYFRKHFHLPSTVNTVTLTLRDVVEDGAVFYLNGHEVLRRNMSGGPVIFTTLSAANQTDPTPIEGPFNLRAHYLVAGDNVLAVEVHQTTGTSSDVEMAAELTANVPSPLSVPVRINEWMASNTGSVLDPADGLPDDWFELYNAGDSTVDLGGFHLTDLLINSNKFTIPSGVTIPPHGYLLFWADNSPGQGSNHVNFAFSAGGEAIGLYAPDFSLVDSVTFGPQQPNISEGRAPDGSENIVSFAAPTPQALNPGPPVVTVQPQSLAVALGTTVFFSVGITSSVPVTYQWHVNCRNIHNATNATLVISNAAPEDVGTYSVTVRNIYGQATSWDAALDLTNYVANVAPAIEATQNGIHINLRWLDDGTIYNLQETASLNSLPAVWTNSSAPITATGAYFYAHALLTGAQKFFRLAGVGSNTLVQIVNQPLGRSADIGDPVILSVTPAGVPPFSYQWRLNGFTVIDATNSTLAFILADNTQFGAYQVAVEDAAGSTVSRPAVIRPAMTETILTDSFAARPLFTTSSNSLHGVTFDSSIEPGETNQPGLSGGKSVWLKWRAPTTGVVTFDTIGSGFDTLLAAYTGSNVAALTLVGSDDDAASNLCSRIRFNVNSNTDYSIGVAGVAQAEGFFVLNWSFTPYAPGLTIPIIDTQPSDRIVLSNTPAVFTVAAHGLGALTNLSYQWYFNGVPIPANQTGTNASLTVGGGPGTAPAVLGPYFVNVMNGAGAAFTVRSLAAFLQYSLTTNASQQMRFVLKPLGDVICGASLLNTMSCCGGSLAAHGKDPSSVLPPGVNLTVGGLGSGTAGGNSSTITHWAWVNDYWSSGAALVLTGTVSSGKVQVEILDTTDFTRTKYSGAPNLIATLPYTPIAGHTYSIGIGREKRDATYTLKYTQ